MFCYLVAYFEGTIIIYDSSMKVFMSQLVAKDYAERMNKKWGCTENDEGKYEVKEVYFQHERLKNN